MQRHLLANSAAAFLVLAALAAAGPAIASTPTLDTGALTPQTSSSRTAQEVANTGAGAREGHAAQAASSAQAAKSAPRSAGSAGLIAGERKPGG